MSAWAIGLDGDELRTRWSRPYHRARERVKRRIPHIRFDFHRDKHYFTRIVESSSHYTAANVRMLLHEEKIVSTARGGIHERGELREQVDAQIQLSNRHHYLWRGLVEIGRAHV